jgi:hypothetical protein
LKVAGSAATLLTRMNCAIKITTKAAVLANESLFTSLPP